MSAPLVENYACATIMRERLRRALCMPRYTPRDWWECDVFELTASGYFREYEVKLTLADFKKDTEKVRDIRGTEKFVPVEGQTVRGRWVYDQERKHDLLAKGDPRGPAEFWYVTPPGLVSHDLLPPWAGLIELRDRGEGHRPTHRWAETVAVRAPRLHSAKAHAGVRADLMTACYYRFHTAIDSLCNRTATPETWHDEPAPTLEEPAA